MKDYWWEPIAAGCLGEDATDFNELRADEIVCKGCGGSRFSLWADPEDAECGDYIATFSLKAYKSGDVYLEEADEPSMPYQHGYSLYCTKCGKRV